MNLQIKLFRKLNYIFLLFLVLILIAKPTFSQLSEKSEISLLTIGQGKDLYSAFGHSAIYISDPGLNIQYVYNYGTFSFGPDFYMKFTKGEMDYMLSVSTYEDEYDSWTSEDRSVVKQVLNLTLEQKNKLFRFLETNALPENRVYRYDYFYDNCSNRIDSALKIALGRELKFSAEKVVELHSKKGATVRDLTHHYLLDNPWGELGIETCLGISMDKKLTPEQFKFIPDYLMWNLDEAKIESNGTFAPLVKEKTVLYKSVNALVKKTTIDYITPTLIFVIVFILACFFSFPFIHKTFFARVFDFILYFTCGAVGLLLIYLWFFTTHRSHYNFNLIWANPLNFFLSFFILSKRYKAKLNNYFLVYGLIVLITLIFWAILPQKINNAYIFIYLALALRSLSHFLYDRKSMYSINKC
ncbi:MAG: DUF4105 domain-containing protein [Bacteroidia bacterium]